MATGQGLPPTNKNTDLSQIINLNSEKSCSDLESYPTNLRGGVGDIFNGHPLICGGRTGGGKFYIQMLEAVPTSKYVLGVRSNAHNGWNIC